MPMFSQGMVTPGEKDWFIEREREKQEQRLLPTVDYTHRGNATKSNLCLYMYTVVANAATACTVCLTGHSTQMPQNGSRVIGEDSEVPSMSEVKR